jgi:putative membrane protein
MPTLPSSLVVAFVAVLHLYILVLEMFLWDKPMGRRAFGLSPERAALTKVMAANQGLYNGFLAAGLLWSLLAPQALARPLQFFFLGCVLVAGLFGAATASRKILYIQALPALVGLGLVWMG